MSTIFYPKTHLVPHHPQVLHQMVLQLFLMADKYEKSFPRKEMPHGVIMPYGSYFDTGLIQAAGYRYLLGEHKPSHVTLIAFADLPSDISLLSCDYDALHSFLGEMKVKKSPKKITGLSIDNTLFAQHSDPIVCQLPFLRSYQKIDSLGVYIVNKNVTQIDRKKLWKSLTDSTGKTNYVLCTNEIDEMVVEACAAYDATFSESLLIVGSDQKIS